MSRRIKLNIQGSSGDVYVVALTRNELAAMCRAWVRMNLVQNQTPSVSDNLRRLERHLFEGTQPYLGVLNIFSSNVRETFGPIRVNRRGKGTETFEVGPERFGSRWNVDQATRANYAASVVDDELSRLRKDRTDLLYSERFHPARREAVRQAGGRMIDLAIHEIRSQLADLANTVTETSGVEANNTTRLESHERRVADLERKLNGLATTVSKIVDQLKQAEESSLGVTRPPIGYKLQAV